MEANPQPHIGALIHYAKRHQWKERHQPRVGAIIHYALVPLYTPIPGVMNYGPYIRSCPDSFVNVHHYAQ